MLSRMACCTNNVVFVTLTDCGQFSCKTCDTYVVYRVLRLLSFVFYLFFVRAFAITLITVI